MRSRVLAVTAVVVLVLGFMIGLQFRVTQGQTLSPDDLGSMANLLLAAEAKNKTLEADLSKLRLQVAARLKGKAEVRTLVSELNAAKAAAGLTAVTGPGILVTLTQPSGVPSGDIALTIHDTDLLILVNELRSAGATAISINGQRLVATSEIRQAGSVFSINDTPAAAPFTVTAAGPPATLSAALQITGGIVSTLRAVGIGVTIRTPKQVTVPAYQGTDLP